jgi:hypothetical protein
MGFAKKKEGFERPEVQQLKLLISMAGFSRRGLLGDITRW